MFIIKKIKKIAYFWVAGYFAFWAGIFLKKWNPLIITVIGSSGKTTLLHLFESQLRAQAIYSHKANSAFGIPFHILGLERKTFHPFEWISFTLLAPFRTMRAIPKESIYVTEADAERPGEGKLLAKLLRPHVVVWLSLEEAHGINYDRIAQASKTIFDKDARDTVKKVIANEFSYFLKYSRKYAVLNKDNEYIVAKIVDAKNIQYGFVSSSDISEISFAAPEGLVEGLIFETSQGQLSIPHLVPSAVGLSALAVADTMKFLGFPFDPTFAHFDVPPGRSGLFKGKKETTLIDSTYNATFDGMRAMLDLIARFPSQNPGQEKWLVLGDMIEQGKSEQGEHIELAEMIKNVKTQRIVLVGPRLRAHTYPLLAAVYGADAVVSYMMPGEALAYLERELKGGEIILLKGARYLEGVVEKLLENPADASKLCRREAVWVKKRKQWGI